MEISWLVVWTITGLVGVGAVVCIGNGLILHFFGRADILTKKLEGRRDELNQQMQNVRKKIEELEKKRNQLGQDAEVDDLDWRIDDTEWRLKDLDWEISDVNWEIDDRGHQKRTSKAAFWTVLGAALFALAGLVFSIGGRLIG